MYSNMGEYVNKKIVIDSDTGEVVKEDSWIGYDGFNSKGFRYRFRGNPTKIFMDSIPSNLSMESLILLFMMEEIANEENALVRKIERKSKFSSIVYLPLDKEEIRTSTRYTYGMNKFDRCWRELNKRCIKKLQYRSYLTWIINPAIIHKTKYIPFWLYEDFQDSMNPHLSALTIKKLQGKIHS